MSVADDSEDEVIMKSFNAAIEEQDVDTILNLIRSKDFDVNMRDISLDLQTPLMKICYLRLQEKEIIKILHELLELDPEVNAQDAHGRTAMMHSCISGHGELADCFISDPLTRIDVMDFDGNSVLIHALQADLPIVVKRILDHPGGMHLLDVYNSNGLNPLMFAEQFADKKMTKLLNSHRKSVIPCTPRSETERSRSRVSIRSRDSAPNKLVKKTIKESHSPSGTKENIFSQEPLSSRTITIDDETHVLTNKDVRSNNKINRQQFRKLRRKVLMENQCKDGSLPDIHEGQLNSSLTLPSTHACPRSKTRRNSVSLPDLRDLNGCLVASGESTPGFSSENESESSNDVFEVNYEEAKNPPKADLRKCVTHDQIYFPKINDKRETVKRTQTEGCVFRNQQNGCGSRSIQISHLL